MNRKDLFSSFSEKVTFQQDNTFHSRHNCNILAISGTCLTLITFHTDTLKGIRIHLVKQKCHFSSLLHNKFGLYKEKHFFIQNNLLYLTIQLLKSCGMRRYGSLAQRLSSYLSIFHFKGFLISALHIIYKIWKMRFGFRKPLGNWSHFSLQKHLMIKVNAERLVTLRQHDGQLLEFLSLTNKWFIFRAKAWKASPWPEQ